VEKCYLRERGGCSSKISREHYVSQVVLEAISPNRDITVGGLAWQQPNTLQGIGIGSLQSKVLCVAHNSMLSPLDAVAGCLVDAIVSADKDPSKLPEETELDGPSVERWFLKTVISSSEAGALRCKRLTEKHKQLLFDGTWPDGWGLYVRPPAERTIFSQDLFLATSINPSTGELLAAKFVIAGVEFWLLLGKPDQPETWGFFRPRGLVFQNGNETKRIGFRWPVKYTDTALIFTKVGVTTETAPHTRGWRQKDAKSDT
jgi:hypothetical protein